VDYVRLAWERFGVLARVFGDMQARVIASLLYFTLILPFGLIMKLTDHPFKQAQRTPHWDARDPVENTLDGAKRQG
jgi:hypothetical protein